MRKIKILNIKSCSSINPKIHDPGSEHDMSLLTQMLFEEWEKGAVKLGSVHRGDACVFRSPVFKKQA